MLEYIGEGVRIFRRRLAVGILGTRKYKGNANEICRQIIEDCWNNRFFQTSTGHFCQFYVRDFAFCTRALMTLGHKERVRSTLEYAMGRFAEHGRITTTLTPGGTPIEVFTFAADTLPLFLMSLRIAGCKDIVHLNRRLIESETRKYFRRVVDSSTGLVRKNIWLSSIKDNAKRASSMYDNTMVALLSRELESLNLPNPLRGYNYPTLLKRHFWTGSYFLEDLSGSNVVSGDANTFPFWTGIFRLKSMLSSAIRTVQQEGLDNPFPLVYTRGRSDRQINPLLGMVVPNYEGNSVWMHMGPLFIENTIRTDRKKAEVYLAAYARVIEDNANYLELFTSESRPFRTAFYYADEGMLWASIYLYLAGL